MESIEEWRPVVGYEGSYEVSDLGRVRSVDRYVIHSNGRPHFNHGRILRPNRSTSGHLSVELCGQPAQIHTLVLTAFVDACPGSFPEWECRHMNGDPADNRLANLKWGTRSENRLDSVRHGTHNNARKTHCKRGHEFTPENVAPTPSGGRQCRTCAAAAKRRYEERKKARESA